MRTSTDFASTYRAGIRIEAASGVVGRRDGRSIVDVRDASIRTPDRVQPVPDTTAQLLNTPWSPSGIVEQLAVRVGFEPRMPPLEVGVLETTVMTEEQRPRGCGFRIHSVGISPFREWTARAGLPRCDEIRSVLALDRPRTSPSGDNAPPLFVMVLPSPLIVNRPFRDDSHCKERRNGNRPR